MTSKRKNYLSLLKEFDEVKIISSTKKIKNKIIKIKNYIFILYSKKNSMIKKKNQISKRAIWKKNFNRVLAGRNLNRLQKSSFIGQYN